MLLFVILLCVFFFFKQKTAYEMLRSLVGSEMCIRDRAPGAHGAGRGGAGAVRGGGPGAGVPIVQAAALLPRAVVVGHDPAACRLRVLARTRPSDAAGPRPCRRRDRLAAVLAVLAARRQAAVPRSGLLPGALMDGAQQVGDPIAILPVLFL